jgi:polysaccharide biosynthesis transport protein
MENASKNSIASRNKSAASQTPGLLTPEHCLRLLYYRKWLILGIFATVSAVTMVVTARLPNVYSSDTLIMVDPQKVPESYVKATVSGDIHNRLGTLKQQILSATRLQKVIDNLNLYPVERKTMAREDVITRMRSDIAVSLVSDFGGGQDLQAFRISYSGADPTLVSQVANDLATQFIEENMKAREQQAEGTADFLANQLEDTRKTLEQQEAKLRDFRLKHIGEMPEQQTADLQMLGQLQSQLQLEADALNRAQSEKSYAQSMMATQPGGVVELDGVEQVEQPLVAGGRASKTATAAPAAKAVTPKERELAEKLARGFKESHPDVKRLRQEIAQQEQAKSSKQAAANPATANTAAPSANAGVPRRIPENSAGGAPEDYAGGNPANPASSTPEAPAALLAQIPLPPPSAAPKKQTVATPRYVNPILQGQVTAADSDIAKHKDQMDTLKKRIAGYEAKLEQIPVNEQQITELVRDYEISKAHYGQLLNNQLSAATATQLEVRQKGEKFSVLDPAQPAQKPSKPNRLLFNLGGCLGGLALGLFVALGTEFLGMSITSPEHLRAATGFPVLEVIPLIETRIDRLTRRRRMFMAAVSGAAAVITVVTVLAYHFRSRFF